jgi:hypothetical protein
MELSMANKFYTADELRRRAADMIRDIDLLASGWRPDARVLVEAPLISGWSVVERGSEPTSIAMIDMVTGHPRFPSVRPVLTSPLIAVDLVARWARTEGRFYRLGDPRDFTFDELLAAPGPKA